MDYILLLKILGLAWTITSFAPISWLVELLPNNMFKYILVLLTSCFKCCSLWVGLIMGGLWVGITASAIAYIYTQIETNVKHLWIRWLNKKIN